MKQAIDWQAADSIAVKLGGRVALDAREGDDREFFEGLELGQDVELVVVGTVVSVAAIAAGLPAWACPPAQRRVDKPHDARAHT